MNRPSHAACIPLNPIPVEEYLALAKGLGLENLLTLPALHRVIELATEAFPNVKSWKVGRTLEDNRSVFFGRLTSMICLSLSFPEGNPRKGRAVLFRLEKGALRSRSQKPVVPILDDPIDGFVTADLVGWFSWAKICFEEETSFLPAFKAAKK